MIRRHSDREPSTVFWVVTSAVVLAIAYAYIAVARVAWHLELRAAAYFGIAMAVALIVSQSWQWHSNRQQHRRAMARIVADRLIGGPPIAMGQAMVQTPRGWRDALYERLMPHSYHPVDVNEKRTFVRLDVHVNLSWDDRLRLLLCGQMRVLSTVYTDVEVKQCTALTNIEVHPFTVRE